MSMGHDPSSLAAESRGHRSRSVFRLLMVTFLSMSQFFRQLSFRFSDSVKDDCKEVLEFMISYICVVNGVA